MKTTTRMVIVDARPCDYLGMQGGDGTMAVEQHLLPSGRDALRFSGQMTDAAWLINTQLPDMSGMVLYRMLRRRLDGARVFFVSDQYSVDCNV